MDKEWLFQENVRLTKLSQELEEQKKILKLEQEKLSGEKEVFKQQKKVLEIGFQKLAADKEMFQAEMKKHKEEQEQSVVLPASFRGPGFFGGVTGYSSLKKRYKELMKVFHPDNKNGDAFTVACINKEYDILKEKYKKQNMKT